MFEVDPSTVDLDLLNKKCLHLSFGPSTVQLEPESILRFQFEMLRRIKYICLKLTQKQLTFTLE